MSGPRGDPQYGSTPAECTVRTAHTPGHKKRSVLIRTMHPRSLLDLGPETSGASVDWVVGRSSLRIVALRLIEACSLGCKRQRGDPSLGRMRTHLHMELDHALL